VSEPIKNQEEEAVFASEEAVLNLTGYFEIPVKKEG